MTLRSDADLSLSLSDMLLHAGAATADGLARAQALAARDGGRIDRILLKLGLVEEDALLAVICASHEIRRLIFAQAEADAMTIRALSPDYLLTRMVVPVKGQGQGIVLAMADPLDLSTTREIGFIVDQPVTIIAATSAEVRALLTRAARRETNDETGIAQTDRDSEDLRRAGVDGPVIRFVQDFLSDAVLSQASDIHIEESEGELRLRYRLQGVLVPQPVPPQLKPASVVARLKVMAGLNVSERRLPQDGRLQAIIAGRRVDFRFSSLPTHAGESIVARVLDPKSLRLGWGQLGFEPDTVNWIKQILERPSGLFLVTGPTGSGKTTTLYTALAHLNTPSRKIVTVEDPVEYHLLGMQQIQVQEEVGLSFATVLRSVLRHDPNVIMVGEIRDSETAEIAVRAAQVGRLVLSTLHTNSAAGAVNRLIDLGVPDFLLRDVLHGVLGQELRMMPCSHCHGSGCTVCNQTGIGSRKLFAEQIDFRR